MAKPEKHKPQDDGNSEKELIGLLKTVLSDMFKEVHESLHRYQAALAHKETKEQERHQTIVTALETITASITAGSIGQAELTTAVNAAIVRLGQPSATDAQLLTLAAAVDALNASDVSLKDALTAALNVPPVEPPTP